MGRKASASLDVKIVVVKPTNVEMLLEPDVRPPHLFRLNFTLTSFPLSKTHILLPSLQKLRIVALTSNNGRLKLSIRTEPVLNGPIVQPKNL